MNFLDTGGSKEHGTPIDWKTDGVSSTLRHNGKSHSLPTAGFNIPIAKSTSQDCTALDGAKKNNRYGRRKEYELMSTLAAFGGNRK